MKGHWTGKFNEKTIPRGETKKKEASNGVITIKGVKLPKIGVGRISKGSTRTFQLSYKQGALI